MIQYATNETYQDLLQQDFAIVDFFSDTCGPCKVLAKYLEEITAELPFVNIIKVNCSSYPKLGRDNEIDAVPTIFFVRNGEIKERVVGLLTKDEVMDKISEHYYG